MRTMVGRWAGPTLSLGSKPSSILSQSLSFPGSQLLMVLKSRVHWWGVGWGWGYRILARES